MDLRIGQFVALRDKKKAMQDRHKEELKPINDALEKLGNLLLQHLHDTNQENAKSASGTAYTTLKKSATISDPDAFRRFVIGSEAWDLLDFKANAPAVSEFIVAHNAPPPGVNYSTHVEIGVRRK